MDKESKKPKSKNYFIQNSIRASAAWQSKNYFTQNSIQASAAWQQPNSIIPLQATPYYYHLTLPILITKFIFITK